MGVKRRRVRDEFAAITVGPPSAAFTGRLAHRNGCQWSGCMAIHRPVVSQPAAGHARERQTIKRASETATATAPRRHRRVLTVGRELQQLRLHERGRAAPSDVPHPARVARRWVYEREQRWQRDAHSEVGL